MKAYKGFDKDLKCRDFQYEIGKEYEEPEASICNKGFHACEHPLDCFRYYAPSKSRYCEVEIEDNGERSANDSKVCGKKIKIGKEIGIPELVKAAFAYVKSKCTNSKDGDYWSALRGGDFSALNGGNYSALNGGDSSALRGGDSSALKGGNYSALNGGQHSVLYGGSGAKVKAGKRSVLALQYWVEGEFKGIRFAEVDGVKIKEDTFYKLDENGEFIKAEK